MTVIRSRASVPNEDIMREDKGFEAKRAPGDALSPNYPIVGVEIHCLPAAGALDPKDGPSRDPRAARRRPGEPITPKP